LSFWLLTTRFVVVSSSDDEASAQRCITRFCGWTWTWSSEDEDGSLSERELRVALQRLGVKTWSLDFGDAFEDGKMSFDEFRQHLPPAVAQLLAQQLVGAEAHKMDDQLRQVFKALDVNAEGKVLKSRLADLAVGASAAGLAVLRGLDADNDGYVDLNEFLTGMNSAQSRLQMDG